MQCKARTSFSMQIFKLKTQTKKGGTELCSKN
nr:MAG TPA: hypothetical protein [Bacteriophage sp.]